MTAMDRLVRAVRGRSSRLALPDLLLRTAPEGGQVNRVALASGRVEPIGVAFHGATVFAASETYLVWVHDGRLGVYDRGAGSIRELGEALPAPPRTAPSPTSPSAAGSSRTRAARSRRIPPSPGPSSSTSAAPPASDLGAEAFVAGDRIAWREGDHYTVARTR